MNDKQLRLDEVVLIGRTFAEYSRLFALDMSNADDVILDVASGVSSFCAEANAQGFHVTASDRIYGLDADVIARKAQRDLAQVMGQLPTVADQYVWTQFGDIAGLIAERETAYTTFVADYRAQGTRRYVPTSYPATGFADNQFTLALASHFLLLYDEHLTYDFHQATLKELLRVTSREVRLFPLINLRYERSPFVARLMQDPTFAHCTFEIVPVDYEFLRGGNEMLRIRRG